MAIDRHRSPKTFIVACSLVGLVWSHYKWCDDLGRACYSRSRLLVMGQDTLSDSLGLGFKPQTISTCAFTLIEAIHCRNPWVWTLCFHSKMPSLVQQICCCDWKLSLKWKNSTRTGLSQPYAGLCRCLVAKIHKDCWFSTSQELKPSEMKYNICPLVHNKINGNIWTYSEYLRKL